jgi:hypothetical protein
MSKQQKRILAGPHFVEVEKAFLFRVSSLVADFDSRGVGDGEGA